MKSPPNFLDRLMNPFRSRRKDRTEEEDLEAIAAKEQRLFRYETLVAATRNFSPKNKLGEGGFGPVYKGRLEDGREVAVKKLGAGSRQGSREFQNEAMLLSRVQHRNVVNLYGYCTYGNDKLLVYEYVSNESLDKLLFASATKHRSEESKTLSPTRAALTWQRRYEIITGIARGLLYLHEDAHIPIIHRDIKASNILLNQHFSPKIADFGMARLYPESQGGQTHVNTRVAGTNGYMAPEYLMHGALSTKADVFSFGVVVLELVSGMKNSGFSPPASSDAQNLLDWAYRLHRKGLSMQMLDAELKDSAVPDQVAMCVQIGLLCTQADPKLRPDMKRVVVVLSKKPTRLEEPTGPGMPGSRSRHKYGSGESSSNNTNTNTSSTSSSSMIPSGSGSGLRNSNNNTVSGSSSSVSYVRRSQGLDSVREERGVGSGK
ncbi:hypothetical protein LUZ60_003129 [Juncus effusus]|nr:hypothetical protein LUZ60_003129 [Juncus effusus]